MTTSKCSTTKLASMKDDSTIIIISTCNDRVIKGINNSGNMIYKIDVIEVNSIIVLKLATSLYFI